MLTGAVDWFYLVFTNNRRQIEDTVQFCNALCLSFEDRLPDYLRHSMPVRTGWFAISLYVQIPAAVRPGRLKEEDVDYACERAAEYLTAWLTGPTDIDTSEIRDAFPEVIRIHWNLWNSAFGFPPEHEELHDFDGVFARLGAMFDNEELNLRDGFGIPARRTPEEIDQDGDCGDEETDAGDDLCTAYALFFDICSRSRPRP